MYNCLDLSLKYLRRMNNLIYEDLQGHRTENTQKGAVHI